MIEQCEDSIIEIRDLIQLLNQESYTKPLSIFSGSSIGQHVRHVLEFYSCLLAGITTQKVNYDLRKRSLALETRITFTIETINNICNRLATLKDSLINLEGIYLSADGKSEIIKSSVYRELAFCYEHTTHHKAFIKMGLQELNLIHLAGTNFGVHPTTAKHKEKCVQ